MNGFMHISCWALLSGASFYVCDFSLTVLYKCVCRVVKNNSGDWISHTFGISTIRHYVVSLDGDS